MRLPDLLGRRADRAVRAAVASGAASWDLLATRALAGVSAPELGTYLVARLREDVQRSGVATRPGWEQEARRRLQVLHDGERGFADAVDAEVDRCLSASDQALASGCALGTREHDLAMATVEAGSMAAGSDGASHDRRSDATAAFLRTWWERDLWEATRADGPGSTLVAAELAAVRAGDVLPRTAEEIARRDGLLSVLLLHFEAAESGAAPPE
jgi:hypothetical protein